MSKINKDYLNICYSVTQKKNNWHSLFLKHPHRDIHIQKSIPNVYSENLTDFVN